MEENQTRTAKHSFRPSSMLSTILALSALLGILFFSLRAPTAKWTARIALKMAPCSSLVLLADKKGYFKDEGLDIELVPVTTGQEALDSLWSGKADFAVTYETAMTMAILEGKQPVALTELFSSTSNTAVIFSKRNGIRSPSDMRGKTVGLPMGTTAEFAFELFLAAYSVPRESVRIVDVPIEKLGESLKQSGVDAVVAWEPKATKILQEDSRWLGRMNTEFFTQTAALVSSRESIKTQGDAPARMIRALRRALAHYKSHPVEARKSVLQAMGFEPSPLTEAMWERARPHIGLSSVLVTVMKEELDWFGKKQRRDSRASQLLEEYFEPAYLNQVAPELVTYQ